MSVSLLVPILFNGVSLSAIYILVALGFTLVFGIMRVVNFAHGEFAMMGGFCLLFLLDRLGLPYWVALPLAALLVGVVALLPERFVFRPLYGQELPSMIAALGLSVAVAEGGVILFQVHERSLPAAFSGLIQIGGFTFPEDRLIVVAIACAATGKMISTSTSCSPPSARRLRIARTIEVTMPASVPSTNSCAMGSRFTTTKSIVAPAATSIVAGR